MRVTAAQAGVLSSVLQLDERSSYASLTGLRFTVKLFVCIEGEVKFEPSGHPASEFFNERATATGRVARALIM